MQCLSFYGSKFVAAISCSIFIVSIRVPVLIVMAVHELPSSIFYAAISCGCILAAKVKILIGGLRPDGGQIAHHVLIGGPL